MAMKSLAVHIERNLTNDDDKLIVAQFPAMNSQFRNDPDHLQIFVKPKSSRMKLNLDDGKNLYVSSRNSIDDSQLFVCRRVNEKLVCLPVSHFCAIRSDFSHLNPKEEVDPREEIRPVSIKFASTDRHQTPSKSHDSKYEHDDVDEDFKPFSFKAALSKYAGLQREVLFGCDLKIKTDPDAMIIDKKPDIDHLKDIKPKIEKMDVEDIYSGPNYASTDQKKSDFIKKRVKECLTKAKLVSYQEVYQFVIGYNSLSQTSSDELVNPSSKDILDSLSEYGLLVQGNWAIKSEVLYGDSGERESTDVTGIPINLFTAARDYLIWLFDQNRVVSRLSYNKKVKLPDHDVLELLNQLAIFRQDIRKWELKLTTDTRFMDSFPEVIQRQNTLWKVRKANKLAIFK